MTATSSSIPRPTRPRISADNNGLWAYTNIACDGKVISSGYPGGPIVVYDPKLPWTVTKGGPPTHPAPWRSEPTSNPREMGGLARDTRVGIAHCSTMGADGKIYFGGFGERGYCAGGFGWYDPKTEKYGGFWKPLSGHAVFWLAPFQEGRLIAMSTRTAPDETNGNRVPDEAKLFIYDVQEGRIVREIIPVPQAPGTGLIFAATPERLLGLTVDPEHCGRQPPVWRGRDHRRGAVQEAVALAGLVGTRALVRVLGRLQ